MFMTIINLGHGHSGIRLETLELIRDFLNNNLVPFAPGEGSVGYLGVEAHLVMAYIGEGHVLKNGKKYRRLMPWLKKVCHRQNWNVRRACPC